MATQGNSGFFLHGTIRELIEACSMFYRTTLASAVDKGEVRERRRQLAEWVLKFHRNCGTLSPQVKESIDCLYSDNCVVLMTAHQPNLFAYGGVLRKATLNNVLARKLAERLGLSVIDFFGLADQDFTDDRWVRSALLPDVERRSGTLDLRVDLPKKIMLNRVSRPPRKTVQAWRDEVQDWLSKNTGLVAKHFDSVGGNVEAEKVALLRNFHAFWEIVEKAYYDARTYSDFNAFLMSRIVNDAWKYGTLFARFSECQQVFEREFVALLSRFDDYSRYLKEATNSWEAQKGGVNEQEYETIPFWYHCDCGSKARLMAVRQGQSLIGRGACLGCGKEYCIDFRSKNKPEISGLVSRISARSLAMPLVFFKGLGVSCYVGGVAGKEYLDQGRYVGEHMGIGFPPVAVWRPGDDYIGVGQLASLMTFKKLSGTLDVSQFAHFRKELEEKLARVKARIEAVETQKRNISASVGVKDEVLVKEKRALSARQHGIRRETGFTVLSRQLKLLENIRTVLGLHACVIDYAVNIGLERTSEQWTAFLEKAGDFSSDVHLDTVLERLVPRNKTRFSVE